LKQKSASWLQRCLALLRHPDETGADNAAPPPETQTRVRRILIAGWRGVSHSLAMVNQHQILALARRSDVKLFHTDMPWAMAHWNKQAHNAGFSEQDNVLIEGLQSIDEAEVDCVYRICSPLFPPNPQARKTVSFAVTELGYESGSLQNPEIPLTDFTRGENLLVTPSRWSRDRLIDFGFDEGRVRVVRHGVDLAVNRPASQEELAVQRQALGIPDDSVIFLNVGVPTWNKGIDLLVRAFATIFRDHRNIRLILKDARGLYGLPVDTVLQSVNSAYPGLLSADVLNAIHVIPVNLSQADLCRMFGFVDWYVSPYRAEGFNLPVLEAQACGTPLIVTSGGATDDFCNTDAAWKIPGTFRRGILNGKACCWVDPEFEALEKLMRHAAAQGPRRAYGADPLRNAARQNAEQHSWDQVASELLALL
jgi:glycosyltransferase involved in cell wall biosynthesis